MFNKTRSIQIKRYNLTAKDIETIIRAEFVLIRDLAGSWKRRKHLLLVLGANNLKLIESLWEMGFDVTVQDSDPKKISEAKNILKNKAAYCLSSLEHLPFDDSSFNYTVLNDPAAYANIEGNFCEISRVCSFGAIFTFINTFSLMLPKMCVGVDKLPLSIQSPLHLYRAAIRHFSTSKVYWRSTHIMPFYLRSFKAINKLSYKFPIGIVSALKVELAPSKAMTPILLPSKDSTVAS